MTKRKSRKNPPARPPLFEHHRAMYVLCALAKGERISVAGGEHLVVTRRGDPSQGCLLDADDLAALEGRGWVVVAGDAETAVCTPAGRKWASIWFRQRHGIDLAQAEASVRNEVGELLAKQGG